MSRTRKLSLSALATAAGTVLFVMTAMPLSAAADSPWDEPGQHSVLGDFPWDGTSSNAAPLDDDFPWDGSSPVVI